MVSHDKTLMLVDGTGFIHRAFHALPPLTTSGGLAVGAVFGFCTMILKIIEHRKFSSWVVIFDTAGKTFRHTLYPAYKANRDAPHPDLIPQFALVRDACRALSIPMAEQPGFEADDLIASYAEAALAEGWRVEIVSSDKDLMQLIQPGIVMYDPIKHKVFDREDVIAKWDAPPERVVDIQALTGDRSDNIPGVPGIGPKTAAALIAHFPSLESMLCDTSPHPLLKKLETVRAHADRARLSKELATLRDDIPLPLALNDLSFRPACPDITIPFLDRMEFTSLKNRLSSRFGKTTQKVVCEDVLLSGAEDIVRTAAQTGRIALILDSNHGIGMCAAPGVRGFLAWEHRDTLSSVLSASDILKVVHDAKTWTHVMGSTTPFDDVMLLSYLTAGGHVKHGLSDIHERLFSDESTAPNTALMAERVLMAHTILKRQLSDIHCTTIYETLERPLVPVLAAMENIGIRVDDQRLGKLSSQFETRIEAIAQKIFAEAGVVFNLASPKQLGEVLFEKLKWPKGKKGKSGAYQTSVDVLEELVAEGHTLAQEILEWRQLAKLKSTYTDVLIQKQNPETSRISTTYNMAETTTGRLSSLSPNLQNIPIRTPEGKAIRACFVAAPEHVLVSFDYANIELRLLAHMGPVPSLQKAFHENQNIHEVTAHDVFGAGPLSGEDRRKAKILNFGVLYGMGAFGLAKQLGIPRQEAERHIQRYFQQYPEIKSYMERMKEIAFRDGAVRTLWGRRCPIPGISSKNGAIRSAAERQAINAPLQGSSADIIKRAMVRVFGWLTETRTPAQLLLQVHDELVFEVRKDAVNALTSKVTSLMEGAAMLSVPLRVHVHYGPHWE